MGNKLIITVLVLIFILIHTQQQNITEIINDTMLNCNKKGILINSSECKCIEGYTTYPKDSKIQCNYELKSDKTARFLSLFGGMLGGDMFYLGYTMRGLFKCFFPLGIFFIVMHIQNNKYLHKKSMMNLVLFSPFLVSLILWLIDLCLIWSGLMNDAYGFSLYKE